MGFLVECGRTGSVARPQARRGGHSDGREMRSAMDTATEKTLAARPVQTLGLVAWERRCRSDARPASGHVQPCPLISFSSPGSRRATPVRGPRSGMDWIFKALLACAAVWLVLAVARRIGRRWAGVCAALPIITAPTLAWLMHERGVSFAVGAAIASVSACAMLACFSVGYALAARHGGQLWALLCGLAGALALAWPALAASDSLAEALVLGMGCSALSLLCIPRSAHEAVARPSPDPLTGMDRPGGRHHHRAGSHRRPGAGQLRHRAAGVAAGDQRNRGHGRACPRRAPRGVELPAWLCLGLARQGRVRRCLCAAGPADWRPGGLGIGLCVCRTGLPGQPAGMGCRLALGGGRHAWTRVTT